MFKLKKYDEAKPFLLEVLASNRRILGNDDPSTASALNSVGVLLKRQLKYAEAESYMLEAFEMSKPIEIITYHPSNNCHREFFSLIVFSHSLRQMNFLPNPNFSYNSYSVPKQI